MGISGLLHHSLGSLGPRVFPKLSDRVSKCNIKKYFHSHIIVGIRFSQFLHFWELFLVDLSTFIQSASSLIFHDRQKRKFRNGSYFLSTKYVGIILKDSLKTISVTLGSRVGIPDGENSGKTFFKVEFRTSVTFKL